MNDFDQYMNDCQTKWRRNNLENQDQGIQNGKKRTWILPRELWKEGLWDGIRSGTNSLPEYLDKTSVQKHDGVHNLKSSWMLCANLYFPFREDHETLAGFLQNHASPVIDTVNRVELEWAEEYPFDPTTLLGEPHGQRGKNQTSPDIAFVVNGGKGIVLTESKFTEHSFYPCSGRKTIYGNPDIGRCTDIRKLYNDTCNQCYMLQWASGERTNRKYWDYLKLAPESLDILRRCPAATAGYQLFRQQALAEALVQKGAYEFAISCVAYDERNQVLLECLRSTGLHNFASDWGFLFAGEAKFSTFTHQQWVKWISSTKKRIWQNWLHYVNKRYEL